MEKGRERLGKVGIGNRKNREFVEGLLCLCCLVLFLWFECIFDVFYWLEWDVLWVIVFILLFCC